MTEFNTGDLGGDDVVALVLDAAANAPTDMVIGNIMSLAVQAFAFLLDGEDRTAGFATFLREHSDHKDVTDDDVHLELGRAGLIAMNLTAAAVHEGRKRVAQSN
jgi:hypothetical protein